MALGTQRADKTRECQLLSKHWSILAGIGQTDKQTDDQTDKQTDEQTDGGTDPSYT